LTVKRSGSYSRRLNFRRFALKKPISFVALAALFLIANAATSLRAQDAASTPFRTTPEPIEPAAIAAPADESPTATPAPKAGATPAAKPQQTAAPQVTAPTAAPAISKPSFSPVRALPARSAAPKATPKPARAEEEEQAAPERRPRTVERESSREESGNVPDLVKSHEREWEAGIVNHDTAVIQRLVADDFVGVSSTGRIGDKFTLLYEARRDKNVYKNASARQMSVHTYGSKVAVVLGITKETGTTASGRPFDHTYRFTDTWMERDGKWQCIAAHAAVAGKR
jgi:ketosteroid isomerase-like protein